MSKAYDYIVVGSGSSGAPFATRLAMGLPDKSVLVLEAGGSNQNFRVRSPFITVPDLQNSDLDWGFRTTPQEFGHKRPSYWPRGKCLGGCSSINFMLCVRCDPRGYDHWGLPGWAYKDLEPSFRRLENVKSKRHLPHRGKHGPVVVTDVYDQEYITSPITRAFVQGCVEAGIPETNDYNSPAGSTGSSQCQINADNGVRQDAASCFLLNPELGGACKNLKIRTNAHVARVLFEGKRAVGVELVSGAKIKARVEVILCAGAVQTPQILMLSGVGPKAHLESKGVDCLVDLPGVGQNLKDHVMYPIAVEVKHGVGWDDRNPLDVGVELAKYGLLGKGLLSGSWLHGVAFIDSKDQPKEEPPRLQLHMIPFIGHDPVMIKNNLGLDTSLHGGIPATQLPAYGFTILPSLVFPKSKGFVELKDKNPLTPPMIDPKYLSERQDVDALVELFKIARKVIRTQAGKGVVVGEVYDSTTELDPESDEYMEYQVKRGLITIYHPTSTCKMGLPEDPTAVLDTECRVRGVTALRVVDASSFPDIPSGNTNFPCMMLGERMAELMVAEAKRGASKL